MKKTLLIVLIHLLCFSLAKAQDKIEHIILISIDGLRPEFYLDNKYPAPNLQDMAIKGTNAKFVKGVFPSVTYPSHTTIVTGVLPREHGILYNSPFEKEGQTGKWYWDAEEIKAETLWETINKNGGTTASLFWPVTVNAAIDYNIPEVWPLDKEEDRMEYLKKFVHPAGLLDELMKEATGILTPSSFDSDGLNREARTAFMAAHILEKYKPTLLTLHLVGTDHFQHDQGREGDMVMKSINAVDYAVGQIYEAVKRHGMAEKTALIITGDHGFADIHTRIDPNVWLVENGLQETGNSRGKWKAAFHTSGASAFLYLKDEKDTKTKKKITAILENLPEEQKKMFRILDKKALQEAGSSPEAFLALAPIEGVSMGASNSGPSLSEVKGGTHGFFPDFDNIHTGFIIFGEGIPQEKIHMMGLEEIYGMVLHLLEIPTDKASLQDLITKARAEN
ncbi:MAG: ectonucleotide pyrophosphatase/phosphodiesterase [Bacteroidota bacterium]|nr:ectonucleotide pyrophosphatase/phosphodiesterase [Bacteroidota bacterium]